MSSAHVEEGCFLRNVNPTSLWCLMHLAASTHCSRTSCNAAHLLPLVPLCPPRLPCCAPTFLIARFSRSSPLGNSCTLALSPNCPGALDLALPRKHGAGRVAHDNRQPLGDIQHVQQPLGHGWQTWRYSNDRRWSLFHQGMRTSRVWHGFSFSQGRASRNNLAASRAPLWAAVGVGGAGGDWGPRPFF